MDKNHFLLVCEFNAFSDGKIFKYRWIFKKEFPVSNKSLEEEIIFEVLEIFSIKSNSILFIEKNIKEIIAFVITFILAIKITAILNINHQLEQPKLKIGFEKINIPSFILELPEKRIIREKLFSAITTYTKQNSLVVTDSKYKSIGSRPTFSVSPIKCPKPVQYTQLSSFERKAVYLQQKSEQWSFNFESRSHPERMAKLYRPITVLNPGKEFVNPPNLIQDSINSWKREGKNVSIEEIQTSPQAFQNFKDYVRSYLEKFGSFNSIPDKIFKNRQILTSQDIKNLLVQEISMRQVMPLNSIPQIDKEIDNCAKYIREAADDKISQAEVDLKLQQIYNRLTALTPDQFPFLAVLNPEERILAPYIYLYSRSASGLEIQFFGDFTEYQNAHLVSKKANGPAIDANLATIPCGNHAVATEFEKIFSPQTAPPNGGIPMTKSLLTRNKDYGSGTQGRREVSLRSNAIYHELDSIERLISVIDWRNEGCFGRACSALNFAIKSKVSSPGFINKNTEIISSLSYELGGRAGATLGTFLGAIVSANPVEIGTFAYTGGMIGAQTLQKEMLELYQLQVNSLLTSESGNLLKSIFFVSTSDPDLYLFELNVITKLNIKFNLLYKAMIINFLLRFLDSLKKFV